MAELFETHRQVLEVLKEHTDGLSTAQLVKECRKKSTLDISDDNGKMSKLVNHMRGKYKFITTCDTKHFITPTGLAALQSDCDAPVLTTTAPQEPEQNPDVIDQLMSLAHEEINDNYPLPDYEAGIVISNGKPAGEPFILDPKNSVEAAFIEIVKVFRAADEAPGPVLIRKKSLKIDTLNTLAMWLSDEAKAMLTEIADDLGKLEELPEEFDLNKYGLTAAEIEA